MAHLDLILTTANNTVVRRNNSILSKAINNTRNNLRLNSSITEVAIKITIINNKRRSPGMANRTISKLRLRKDIQTKANMAAVIPARKVIRKGLRANSTHQAKAAILHSRVIRLALPAKKAIAE